MADVLSVSDGYTIRKWREALEAGRTVPDPRATWHPPEEPAAPVDPRRWSRTVEWLEHRGGSGIVVASGRFDYYKPARLLRYRGGKFTFVPDGVIAPYHGDSRRIVVEAIDPDEGAR